MRRSPPSRLHFTIRTNHRFPVSCSVYYLGRGLLGKGLAVNLSMKGWRVRGDESVRQGQWLAFRLQLAHGRPPIDIPRVIVRWTSGKEFGVEWLLAERPAEQKLRGFVRDMAARL